MRLGQCASPVYILTYIDEINDVFIYVNTIIKSLHFSNVFYKNEKFNDQEKIK